MKRRLKKSKNYIDFNRFSSWIDSKSDGEKVGKVTREDHPIVNFFKEYLQLSKVRKSGSEIIRIKFTEDTEECVVNLSPFGTCLFDKINNIGKFGHHITAGEIKELLNKEKNRLISLK